MPDNGPRPATAPDLALALATLPAADRATVARWLDMLGMESDELAAVPPLRGLVVMLAVLALAARMREAGMGREAAFREAADTLGCGDISRSWFRWQRNALTLCQDEDEAA
jgi:hypothetical protein